MTDQKSPNVEYSADLADKMLELISAGKSVAEICRQDGMPDQTSFYRWLSKDLDNLCQKYAHAREHQSEVYAQEMIDMARNCGLTAGEVNKARLVIDTMKWCAAKLKPKKYGDNQSLNVSGTVQHEQLIIQRTPKTIDNEPTIKALPVIDASE